MKLDGSVYRNIRKLYFELLHGLIPSVADEIRPVWLYLYGRVLLLLSRDHCDEPEPLVLGVDRFSISEREISWRVTCLVLHVSCQPYNHAVEYTRTRGLQVMN